MVKLCLLILLGASSPVLAVRAKDIAVDNRGYAYFVFVSGPVKMRAGVLSIKPDGSLDQEFGDGGALRLDHLPGSIDVRDVLAISGNEGLLFFDLRGKELKRFEWEGDYSNHVQFNEDGSVVGAKGLSKFFKLSSDFEFDRSFGVGGRLKLKDKKFRLSQLIERSDGTYVFYGLADKANIMTPAFGCLDQFGTVCRGQDDYYVVERYSSESTKVSLLAACGRDRIYAVGTRDRLSASLLRIDEDMQVISESRISLIESGSVHLTQSDFLRNELFIVSSYRGSRNHHSIHKLGADGQIDREYGVDGVAEIKLSKFYQVNLMQVAAGQGELTLAAQCYRNVGRAGQLCLIRLGADGFLDKTFSEDGVSLLEGF